MRSILRDAFIEAIEQCLLLNAMEGAEYRGEMARPSKFATRALAWSHLGLKPGDPFSVYESHSFPGVIATFYLTLGAHVALNDPDEKLAKEVIPMLSAQHGDAVSSGGDMASADIIDLDPLGVPTADQLKSAATMRGLMVVTDSTPLARKRNGPIPLTFRELADSPAGRWEDEPRSYEEIWLAVADSLNRRVIHLVGKKGGAPAWYIVLR